MIVYANGKVLGTDQLGNTVEIGTQGDELKITDNESRDYFQAILLEMRVMNFHLAYLSGVTISTDDVEE
jgi:hypothetical protein